MEPRSRELFTPAVFKNILSRFGINAAQTYELDGFENIIFACETKRIPAVMRISHSLHRSPNSIRSEIEWLSYLADNGVSVPRVIPSNHGNLVEVSPAEDGSQFIAVAFSKAPGGHVWNSPNDCPANLPEAIGQMMGKLHRITKEYVPSNSVHRRHEWYQDYGDNFATKYLPTDQKHIGEKLIHLNQRLRSVPKDHDSYGLVHFDFHAGNYFVKDGTITLFDFDDCQYNWFAADIAIAQFYNVSPESTKEETQAAAASFYRAFMDGYARENKLDPKWLGYIPLFLKQREIDLYIVIHRSLTPNDWDDWVTAFMRNRRENIENDVPYIDLDF